jgi:RNA polymerase sigma factor (sigma-70 family)
MDTTNSAAQSSRKSRQKAMRDALRTTETELKTAGTDKNDKRFFEQITPLLKPLKDYIKRQLRIAYATLQIRTPVLTSGDILDRAVFRALQNYDKKPPDLTLEQWLYQLVNEEVDRYVAKRRTIDARRRSLEDLTRAELRSLEEPISADAEGEVMLVEDLDDAEYERHDFLPPSYNDDPLEKLEREEQAQQILQALSRTPDTDRRIFELSVIEGLSRQEIARMFHIAPDEVSRIRERVRTQVAREITGDNPRRKAA